MTTTQENARPLPLIGQSVGQAQATLTRLLDRILAESGTGHQTWLGLQRLNALRQDVLATSAQVTGPVLAAVDRGDLEVTIRTLDEITRRVRETFGTEGS